MGEGHPYKVEGIGGDKIPEALHYEFVDEWMTVSDPDAFKMARRLAREEGLFVGGSSGLNVYVALHVARAIPKKDDAMIVVVLGVGCPDTGAGGRVNQPRDACEPGVILRPKRSRPTAISEPP